MNKKGLIVSSLITASILFLSGCSSSTSQITPDINFEENAQNLNVKYFSVQTGDNLSLLVYNLNKQGFNIVEYPRISDELVFDSDIKKVTIFDIIEYINNKYNKELYVKITGGSELVYIKDKSEELLKLKNQKQQEKIKKIKEEQKLKKVFDIPVEINSSITYNELFNNLRFLGYNVVVKLESLKGEVESNSPDSGSSVSVSSNSSSSSVDVEELPSQNFAEVGAVDVVSETGSNLADTQSQLGNLTGESTIGAVPGMSGPEVSGTGVGTATQLKSTMPTPNKFNPNSKIGEYRGSLIDLLSQVEHSYKLFIEYEPVTKTINITDKKMKFYDLKLQPLQIQSSGKDKYDNEINNLQNMVVDIIKPFEDLEFELRKMISSENIVLNRTNGTLSIYGNKGDLERTEIIIDKFNDIYGKSVVIDFKIYEVALNDQNEFGIDYTNLAKKAGNFATTMNANLGANIISSTANTLTFQKWENYTGAADQDFNKGVFNFLNKFGKTSVVTRPILETINNLPVTMNITESKDYVKKITETIESRQIDGTTRDVSSQDIETDTIDTGFQLTLYPRIEKDGIKIALKPLISNLNSLESFEYGSEEERKSIQLKNLSTKDFAQNIFVKPNETVMIGGYIIDRSQGDKNSLPMIGKEDSVFDVLGSAKSRQSNKSELIFTISARIK